MIARPDFTVHLTQHDWSLHRKGADDQARHKERVDEAIKDNLADIIADEAIITSDGERIVKVPVRSLDEYHFRHNTRDQEKVGQGEGGTQVGDIVGQLDDETGSGEGGAGDQPGIDYYEAEINISDLAALVFEDLGLPNLEEKRSQELESDTIEFNDIRRTGSMSNLDKRRTMKQNIKRNATKGDPYFGNIHEDDLRYKTWEQQIRRQTNAVVFAMMDTSFSMGNFEKYLCRAFYFWMVRFLRTQYSNVEIVFVAHHTEAKIVTEQQFFSKVESGGTMASSAYQLVHDLIEKEYPSSDWNIYPFHITDGDNFGNDNVDCLRLIEQIIPLSQQVGYAEVRDRNLTSPLMSVLQSVKDPKFLTAIMREDTDVWPTLKQFFNKELSSDHRP